MFELFQQNISLMSLPEAIAVATGLASVWFAKKENILVYPTGIISVLIYVFVCFDVKLYAEAGINFYYFVMSIYGWYEWIKKDDKKDHIHISKNNFKEQIISIGLFIISFFILSQTLLRFTDSNVPYLDSFATSLFFVAMWLMAKKKIENWTLWIIGDLICIPLYFYKGLMLTSFQYLVFTFIALGGYLEWNKKLKVNSTI